MKRLWDKTCDCCRRTVIEHIEIVLLDGNVLHYCNDNCKDKHYHGKKFKQIKYINEYEWNNNKTM